MSSPFLNATLEGALLGLGLAFLLGPAFFALLQASIDYGIKVSIGIALGVVCSDIALMSLSYLTMSQLTRVPGFDLGLSIVGGVVLIITGVLSIFRTPPAKNDGAWSKKDVGKLFIKGFSINTFNPFPWMFWLSTSTLVSVEYGAYGSLAPFLFFAAAALTVFGTDVLKAWIAQYLVRFLTPNHLRYFRWISGICLIGFGIKLLWTAFA